MLQDRRSMLHQQQFETLARCAARYFWEGGDAQVSPWPVPMHQRPGGQLEVSELSKQQARLTAAFAPRSALLH